MNIGNIAYGWAALMVFTTIKYFKKKRICISRATPWTTT